MKHLLSTMAVLVSLLPSVWADRAIGDPDRPAADGKMIRFEYTLPAAMFRIGGPPPGTPTAQEILERYGVTFGPGAGAELDWKTNKVLVWNVASEIEIVKSYFRSITSAPARNVITIFERIEVERSFLNQWLLDHALDRDGTPLRNAVQQLIRDDQATVLDTAVVTCRSGQRAKLESLSEYIYPAQTSFEIPQRVGEENDPGAGKIMPPPAVPITLWETRNMGITLIVEPLINRDLEIIDLNLAPEVVRLAGFESSTAEGLPPERRVRMPVFHAEKIASQITLLRGHYGFLGSTDPLEASREDTEDPVVLSFVRVDISQPTEIRSKEGE